MPQSSLRKTWALFTRTMFSKIWVYILSLRSWSDLVKRIGGGGYQPNKQGREGNLMIGKRRRGKGLLSSNSFTPSQSTIIRPFGYFILNLGGTESPPRSRANSEPAIRSEERRVGKECRS